MATGVPGSLVGGSVDFRETPCCVLAWLNRRRIPLIGRRGECHRVARGVGVRARLFLHRDRKAASSGCRLGRRLPDVLIGATDAEHAFFSEESAIDWRVIFLLLGMMLIVSILKRTGAFEYVAIWAAKR